MKSTLLRNLDRVALDREYDNLKKVSPEFFRQLSARLDDASIEARDKHRAALDIAYGPSSLERLDIFRARSTGSHVHVFIHGGYWHALDKRDFSYVANGLVPHDITTVALNYPLLPAVRMGEQIAACRRALRWVYDNIEKYGGDSERMTISGHSAGAHLAAVLLMDTDRSDAPVELPKLRQACLISGIYDLEPIRLSFVNDALHLSAEDVASHSPVAMSRHSDCSLAIIVGSDEGREYLQQSSDMALAWTQSGLIPAFSVLENENHFTLRAQLGDPNSEVVRSIVNP